MRKIQILGPGCPRCAELAKRTEEAVRSLPGEYEVEKVTELSRIMSFGVFGTPALVVDGEVKLVGSVPSVAQIKGMLE